MIFRIANCNALLDGTVFNCDRVRTRAAARHKAGTQRRRAFQKTHISNRYTIRNTRPVVAICTIVCKQLIDQAISVNLFAVNIQILDDCIADIIEQRLSTFRNGQLMSIAIQNTAECMDISSGCEIEETIVLISDRSPICGQCNIMCHLELNACAPVSIPDNFLYLFQVFRIIDQIRFRLCAFTCEAFQFDRTICQLDRPADYAGFSTVWHRRCNLAENIIFTSLEALSGTCGHNVMRYVIPVYDF